MKIKPMAIASRKAFFKFMPAVKALHDSLKKDGIDASLELTGTVFLLLVAGDERLKGRLPQWRQVCPPADIDVANPASSPYFLSLRRYRLDIWAGFEMSEAELQSCAFSVPNIKGCDRSLVRRLVNASWKEYLSSDFCAHMPQPAALAA